MSAIGAAVGLGAAQLVGGLIGTAATNAANANLNSRNRRWQENMWHMQNEYNLPVNVMQRYKDAGLNPNLIYGQVGSGLSADVGNAASHPNEDLGKHFNNLGNSIYDNMVQAEQVQSVINVNESQQQLNNANEAKVYEEAKKVIEDTKSQNLNNVFLSETLQDRIDAQRQQVELLKKNNLMSDAQYKQELEKIDLLQEQVRKAGYEADKAFEEIGTQKAITSNVEADTLLKDAQKQAALADAALARERKNTEKMQQKYLASGATLNYANSQVANAYAGKLIQETKNLKLSAISTYCEILKTPAVIHKMASETHLNYQQCNKIINDIYQNAQNNSLDRYLKSFPQRYGTTEAGACLGFIYEVVHGIAGGNTLAADELPVIK